MAITIAQQQSATAGTNSGTVTLPAPATAGNLLLLAGLRRAQDGASLANVAPGTWINIPAPNPGTVLLAYKVATGGEQSITFDLGTINNQVWLMYAFELAGASWGPGSNALAGRGQNYNVASSLPLSIASMQAGRKGMLWAVCTGGWVPPWSNIAPYTQVANVDISGSIGPTLLIAYRNPTNDLLPASESKTFSWYEGSDGLGGVLFALGEAPLSAGFPGEPGGGVW